MFINVRPQGPANLPQGCRTMPGRNRPGLWTPPEVGFGTSDITLCPPRDAQCPPVPAPMAQVDGLGTKTSPCTRVSGTHLPVCPHSTPAPYPCAHPVTQPPVTAPQPSIHPLTPKKPPRHLPLLLTSIRPPPNTNPSIHPPLTPTQPPTHPSAPRIHPSIHPSIPQHPSIPITPIHPPPNPYPSP